MSGNNEDRKVPPVIMNKLYIRNMPASISETAVHELFKEHKISYINVEMKRGGCALIEFRNQSMADKAMDKLHGLYFHGNPLRVEPRSSRYKGKSGDKCKGA